jgi:20S proteasome alpha/beta subunit
MKKFITPALAICLVTLTLAACTNYGKKVKKDFLEVYYKGGVSKEEAQKTADFLMPYWREGAKTSDKSIQLTRSGDTVAFRMVTDEKKLTEVDDNTLYTMANVFSDSLFNNKPVNIELTNNRFKTLRTLHFKKINYNEEPTVPADTTTQQ